MPPVPTADSGSFRPYTKTAGAEPLPGYKLLSPLGRGGFGEVWRCEAPGGLHKAIKFVTSHAEDGRGGERFGQELAAFEQIKSIRHPFLLTLERVEQIDGELIMVMELADRQLQDRFRECRTCGLPGIPRDELLAYFADAAEALDVISAKYNLQHLDIKPANLFLVSGHVKVGDYGLVVQLEGPEAGNRGLTPRYVAPEVLHGTPSKYSDQYSLALVYQELLTGEFPYSGRTPQQLMLQHVSVAPNLTALPPCDEPVVARALAKQPEERYPSCLAFVQALLAVSASTALPSAAMSVRRARVDRSVAEMNIGGSPLGEYPGESPSVADRHDSTDAGPSQSQRPTQNFTLPGQPHVTVPGSRAAPLPPLVTGSGAPRVPAARQPAPPAAPRGSTPGRSTPQSLITTPAPPLTEFPKRGTAGPGNPRGLAPLGDEADEVLEAGQVVLDRIASVMPVAVLLGMDSNEQRLDPQSFATAIVTAASGAGQAPLAPGDVGRAPDGAWVCRFPSTVPASVVPYKLAVVHETWGVSVEQPDPAQVVLRRTVGGGFFGGKKKHGYEVTVQLPPAGKPLGEVTITGRLLGTPDAKFSAEAADQVPKLIGDLRRLLNNVQDRRRHPRVAYDMPFALYPVHSDGSIDPAVTAKCRDVSLGGLGFVTPGSLRTKYIYAAFPDIPAIAGQAILLRLMRTQSIEGGRHYGAQYRTDL